MSDKNPVRPDQANRRRSLLIAMAGAGVPLTRSMLPDQWSSPVVNSVVLSAHAEMSNPTGLFGPGDLQSYNGTNSLFDNIVERSEEEILDLFVSTAEAADSCPTNTSCDTSGTVEVNVAASITQNPSSVECIEALVQISGSSCNSSCQFFSFDGSVSGNTVTVSQACELQLTNIQFSSSSISGSWRYESGNLVRSGQFSSDSDGTGCGQLSCD